MRLGILLALVIGIAPAVGAQPAAGEAPKSRPELRALWVDAFHAGIRSPAEAAQLVADAVRIHANTLFVQVRRRGDALYTGGLEPPLDDPNYDPSFDALAHIVSAAHAAGLQVHAWINAMPVWRDEAAPKDPRHVFNTHGPGAVGDASWLTSGRDGIQKFPVGYFLDPGHPAARDHLVAVYLDIVRRYGVDGIHFDYIRYPETEGTPQPRGADVGYNPVSVARFQKASGRRDVPATDDRAWIEWRRIQVTQLVRRISIEARAINPRIKISAASIAWGKPPATLAEFDSAAPMQRVFQNWQGWLEEGLLDLAVPMNYAREHDERVRGWFNGWIAWEKRFKAGRQLAVGLGGYLNTPESVLAQIERTRASEGKAKADGVSVFSYFQPVARPAAPAAAPVGTAAAPTPPAPEASDRLDFLVSGAGKVRPAFTGVAPIPAMPWIERPTQGYLTGLLIDADGRAIEGATLEVRRTGLLRRTRITTTDANGWFGMTRLSPGTYRIRIRAASGRTAGVSALADVKAGIVTRVTMPRVPAKLQ